MCVQEGLTALMKATNGGHKDVVKSLLTGFANPNITEEVVWVNWCTLTTAHCLYIQATGRNALSMASEQGNLEIVKLLVKGGADVDLQDKVHW